MNEEDHKKQLETLSSNVDRLMSLYNLLLEQNAKLTEEVKNLNTELNIKEEKIKILESKYTNLTFAQGFGGQKVEGNKEAKQKIDKIIREIDNCITLLNK